jgi:heat shock protein 5
VYSLRNAVSDKSNLGGRLKQEDKDAILNAVNNALSWLNVNEAWTAEEYRAKKVEVEAVAQPIIRKVYGRDEL